MNTQPTITIAIADDHPLLAHSMAAMLNNTPGMKVIMVAANGRELVRLLECADVLPHICLLDISMPEMNGYETLPVLRSRWPAIKVLVLSMYSEEQFAVLQMIAGGACGFLAKSGNDDLPKAIRQAHEHGYYLGGPVNRFLPHGLDQARARLVNIAEAEMTFLRHCCSDMAYKEIAALMGKSQKTIEHYRDNLFDKLGVNSRAGLILFANRIGLNPHLC